MKLVNHFDNFLVNTVNINDERLELLDQRVASISNFLASAPTISDIYIDVIPQGSLAHRTIIKPLPSHEFDADILLHVEPKEGWLAKDYIEYVYQAFRTSGNYKDRVTRKNRCVRVQYANDCHVDVVPFLELQSGYFYITNRCEGEEGTYERTDPTGYTQWLDGQNRITAGKLIKVIRLLKWLRDYKQTFTCKSVVMNVLVCQRVNSAHLLSDSKYYSDVPTTLVHLLEDVRDYLAAFPEYMPRIEDPTCPEVDYNHRWDNDQYLNFRQKIIYYASKARAAYDEEDRVKSIGLWRDLFGDKFAAQTFTVANAFGGNDTAAKVADPGEQFIESIHTVEENMAYRLKIVGTTLPKNGFRTYALSSRGNRVESKRTVRFAIQHCNVPGDYTVLWKIKNRGKAAIDAGCLRGEIVGGRTHDEPTEYRGNHYVECYVIKNGKCVARNRQQVVII